MDDLPEILCKEYPNLSNKSLQNAKSIAENIKSQVYNVTAELFSAFESEYSIFCPMANCFEVFGLDFLVDNDCQNVKLLEVNPGPDFKQTGNRLQGVIADLWEQILRVVVDLDVLFDSSFRDENEEEKQDKGDALDAGKPQSTAMKVDNRIRRAEEEGYLRGLTMVYSKEWSVASLQSGMALK